MADRDPEERRSWLRLNIDRIASPDLSIRQTLVKLAPSLHIGSIFGGPARTLLAVAAIAAPTAIVMASVGAIDVIDSDPQVVELTVIADDGTITISTVPPGKAAGTVFDQILAAIEAIDVRPDVTVTVAPVSPEVAQTLIQIGSVLELIQQQNRQILAAIAGIEFEPPPVNPPGLTADQAAEIIEGLDAVLDSQDLIEDAIFPGRGGCPECPESVTE